MASFGLPGTEHLKQTPQGLMVLQVSAHHSGEGMAENVSAWRQGKRASPDR